MKNLFALIFLSIITITFVPLCYSQHTLIYLKTFGNAGTNPGEFNLCLSSYITHDDVYIYICDTNNNRIQKFNINGDFIAWFGYQELSTEGPVVDGLYVNNFGWYTTGTPDTGFILPENCVYAGFEIDSSGNMYILANGYDVWKFDSSGTFIKKIVLDFYYPQVFTIDNLGSLFVKKDPSTY